LTSAAALPVAAASRVRVLWRFSRPHTIVGTTLSVLGLYAIAATELPGPAPSVFDLAWTLVAALAVNVFIVGLNQLEDVEIDRINKPFLPVASGELPPRRARAIVAVCGVVPVVLALTQGSLELAGVLGALAVGIAYSSPPLRLKRFPTLASLSISGVRAVIVNLVVFVHFSGGPVADPVWALTLFVAPFAFAIAILKDVPDAEGDARFRIATFTVRLGPRRVVRAAMIALTTAYLAMALAGPLLIDGVQPVVLAGGHLGALALLWRWRAGVRLEDRASVTRFYMRIWALFFLEYVLVPVAAAL
jgi:homogentisate phytyltransferase / homogentisate geranylgeranyltransferase